MEVCMQWQVKRVDGITSINITAVEGIWEVHCFHAVIIRVCKNDSHNTCD